MDKITVIMQVPLNDLKEKITYWNIKLGLNLHLVLEKNDSTIWEIDGSLIHLHQATSKEIELEVEPYKGHPWITWIAGDAVKAILEELKKNFGIVSEYEDYEPTCEVVENIKDVLEAKKYHKNPEEILSRKEEILERIGPKMYHSDHPQKQEILDLAWNAYLESMPELIDQYENFKNRKTTPRAAAHQLYGKWHHEKRQCKSTVKKKKLANEYRSAVAKGLVTDQDAWAEAHSMCGRTLRRYLKEFPE